MKSTSSLFALVLLACVSLQLSSCNNDGDLEQPERLQLVSTLIGDSIQLSWEPSEDERFDSYELYRHNSSGIDDETGTFIHVSTEPLQTLYVETNLRPNTTAYYRLYHVLSNGEKTGSNVVNETTPSKELLTNGSFEEATTAPWELVANFGNQANSIDVVEDATDGVKALKIYHAEPQGCWEQWIEQRIDLDDLSGGSKYELTFDYKADFQLKGFNIIFRNNKLNIFDYQSISYDASLAWQSYTYEFVLDSDIGSTDPEFSVHFCQEGVHNIWLDNLSLKEAN